MSNPPEADTTFRDYATRASEELERVVENSGVLDRVPGRSVTLLGVGLVVAAIALSMLPSFGGVGMVWSVVMLVGAAAVAIPELRRAGKDVSVQVPGPLQHPLLPAAYAGLVGVHAFLLLRIGIIPLLWLAAAVLLTWDQYRRAAAAPDGFVRHFDLRRAWHGYRRNVTAGVLLCLGSLFMKWGQSSGYWTGGLAYTYGYRYNAGTGSYDYGYDYDYQPMQYYWPGFEFSGRNQSFALVAVCLLVGLVMWAAYRPRDDARATAPSLGIVMGAMLAAFWLLAAKDGMGSLLFLAGLAAILYAADRIRRGEETGRWDLEQVWARTVKRRG
ncbi:MAG TPA: hypothetical protein VHG93_03695 [Longimicrobium sp.]|nr:hypothetical protein [Longimicrobium sp.]